MPEVEYDDRDHIRNETTKRLESWHCSKCNKVCYYMRDGRPLCEKHRKEQRDRELREYQRKMRKESQK